MSKPAANQAQGEKPTMMPKLLVERIRELKIPPAPGQACFDRILVYQIPDEASSRTTFSKDGSIIMPDSTREVKKVRSPRGIIVSAGLRALDIMADHGMELGEMVWFSPHVPTRFEVENSEGKQVLFFFMTIGDVIVSEDIPQKLVDGKIGLGRKNGKHVFGETISDREDPERYADSI